MAYNPTTWRSGDKVTSTKLNKIEQGIVNNENEVTQLNADITAISTATSDDVGKALKAKTVTNGKVTEWEFGETGDNEAIESLSEQMEMLIKKTEIAPSSTGVSIQCVDLTTARYDRTQYYNITIRLPYIGRYNYNPTNLDLSAVYLKAKNIKGKSIAIYRNGYVATQMNFLSSGYFVLENRRTLKSYTSAGKLNDTFTFDEDVATLYGGTMRYVESGSGQPVGVTWGEASETYIAYDSSVFDDVTYTFGYADGLNEHVSAIVDSTHDIFAPSENLLDYSKIEWASSGYHGLAKGYYMPCQEDDVLVCNRDKVGYYFYDSAYTQLSAKSANIRVPVTVPADAVWFRMNFNIVYTSEGDEVMVWKARSVTSAPFERPIYRPYQKYVAKYADSDIFDFAVPSSLSQGVMKWARFVAIRALNESRDAFRFGTFNTYVSRGANGFPVIREMLFNYGIDFCGFQECALPEEIASAVYPWQFPYNTGTRASNYDGVPAVSRFEVVSVSTTTLEEGNNHSVKKITVNLPRNKHYRVATLSVFNYHGTLSSAQVTEAQQIVAMVEQDTADFKIIMGDTNDGGAEKAAWDVFESAGFTAVHHGESPTWPSKDGKSRYESEDNIFVGPNINVLHYDIIRTGTGEITLEDGTTTLSDHDFLFADLQFDFDAVLKDTWTRS